MPDLITVFTRSWKFIIGSSLVIALIALVASMLSEKKYLSVATALPSNSVLSDKARLFNNNIEVLYPELGTPDELDRIEGTAMLDTIYIAAVKAFNLTEHYCTGSDDAALYKAAQKLRKESKIARSGFGELKVQVWNSDRHLAANIANSLLQSIQDLHQQLLSENNKAVLAQLKAQYARLNKPSSDTSGSLTEVTDTKAPASGISDIRRYQQLIQEYELAVQTTPKVLLTVEAARPAVYPDKPRILQTVLFSFAAALACTFLLSLFTYGQRQKV